MSNPLLDGIKLPGRTFQLPSKGLFYPAGVLADTVVDGEIHVHPLSALDEITLKNPDQLFSGEAIQYVIPRCIPSILRPQDLLSKDVDAIMVFLRAVTYGTQYEFYATHRCKDAKEHSYVTDIENIINGAQMVDESKLDEIFTVVLPTGQVVKLTPSRYIDVLTILKNNMNRKNITPSESRKNAMHMLVSAIMSVDEITDKAHIEEWLDKIPAPMTNKIVEKIEGVNIWGINTTVTCVCKDCGEEFKSEIPLNPISFFTE